MPDKENEENQAESDEGNHQVQPTVMMREVEARVLSFTIFFSRDAPKVQNLHIGVRRHHTHRKRVDLHERLLEEVSK